MEISIPNVLGFILSNLNRPNRLRTLNFLLNIKAQEKQSFDDILVVLQREVDETIVENLKLWRRVPLKRPYILRRIQALRRLYLELFRKIDKRNLSTVTALIQDVLNVWSFDT